MDNDFRNRLSFSDSNNGLSQRENWRRSLDLLQKSTSASGADQHQGSLLLHLPTIPNDGNDTNAYLEWEISEDSLPTRLLLAPYYVDNTTRYRIPSLSHLFTNLKLDHFDHAWALFFADHFCHDNARILLDTEELIHEVLWRLSHAKRLRLTSDKASLEPTLPLQLKARLRYSEEWALFVLDAELVTQTGEMITPESLDFITLSGLAVYNGKLFPLATGSAWIVQLLESGAWFIAREHLGEALYQLSHRIHDGEFFRHLAEIQCVTPSPRPIVYLRAKHFDKQTPVTFYLAYRYGDCEVFSLWHNQDTGTLPIHFESTDGVTVFYFRDFTIESEFELFIKHETTLLFIANKRAWVVPISALWELVHRLLRKGWEVWAEKHKLEELSSFGVNIESKIGWFELQPLDTNVKRRIDPLQLIKYLKRKALFIQLGNGEIGVLPENWITHLTPFLDVAQPEENAGWCFSSIYSPEVEKILGEEPAFNADEAFHKTVERMRSFSHLTPLTQPEGLRAILRPYQLEGLTWLNLLCELHVGGILADDMGLGKTVQILALLQHRFVNQPQLTPQTILVVCPKSVQNHWLVQTKNLVPRLSCRLLHSQERLTKPHHLTQHQLLLASYGLIRHHIESLSTWQFDLLILDEAQMIKNESSQTTQAIKQLQATQRFALTGTPIENRFEELVSIFTFLNPRAQLNLSPSSSTAEAVRNLVERALHPFVLRRLKEDVLTDLPPKIIKEMLLPLEPDQGRLYKELQEVYRSEISKRRASDSLPTEAESAFFLEGLLRLRQVATHPQQLIGDQFQNCPSNKILYLRKQIPVLIENGHRVVIFSQFLGFLRDLSNHVEALNIRYIYVDGETIERDREIALFQSNPAIKVLLISLRVGGVGIDLTNTDVCVIADPWWNEAVEKQAIDRLHRFGQKKTVTVLKLISEDSVEEKMEILKQSKSALADAIGKTNPDFLNHLKWDDFTKIF